MLCRANHSCAPNAVGRCRLTPGTPWLEAVDPALAFRNFQLLKRKHDELLSNVGFNCKLRQYNAAWVCVAADGSRALRSLVPAGPYTT